MTRQMMMNSVWILACAALALLGCSADITYYRLSFPESDNPVERNTNLKTVMLEPFTIANKHRTNYFVTVRDGTTVRYDYFHRWTGEAQQVVSDIMYARLVSDTSFKLNVLPPNSEIEPDYRLEGHVLEMLGVENGDKSTIRFTLQLILVNANPRDTNQNILLQHLYSEGEFCVWTECRFDEFAGAMKCAIAQTLDKIIQHINQKLPP